MKIATVVQKEKIMKLFKHRHFGYGFYISYEKIIKEYMNDKIINNIINKETFREELYYSLSEYFYNFYGSFYDNELAIQLLCTYYPNDVHFNEQKEEVIVSAIFIHCSNAGTPNDIGYAYKGINTIENYIVKLPTRIVEKLLKKYKIVQIVYNKINRRQVYTIIKYSSLTEEKKQLYKFFFIDSICIASTISPIIFRKYKKTNHKIFHVNMDSNTLDQIIMPIFQIEDNDEMCFWSYDENNFGSRILKYKNRVILEICLDKNILIKRDKNNIKTINFKNDDWLLNEYDTNKFEDEIEKLFEIEENRNSVDGFTFSYVYLNDYRGIINQEMSFDHKYYYDVSKNTIVLNSAKLVFNNFYGKNIYSLTCIVGKNGTGKTSIIDFLQKYFFSIIYIFDNIGSEILINKEIGLPITVAFLIIFNFKGKPYYLANIDRISSSSDIKQYTKELLIKRSENSKVLYFSSKIDMNDFVIDSNIEFKNAKSEEDSVNNSLRSYTCIDYSENTSYLKKLLEYKQERNNNQNQEIINKDFCYKLAYLAAHNDNELTNLFGENFSINKLTIENDNELLKNFINKIRTSEILSKQEKDQFKKTLSSQQSTINYFSSGQYAKFSFLSKLYWCLVGYNIFHSYFEYIIDSTNEFDVKNTIQKNDTAIIFIDEGELYYHPEWQRTYINDLLKIINTKDLFQIQIQIVITTNSPFIISDIINQDITYLNSNLLSNNLEDLTFGQNIHTLLKNNFFLDFTIGEFAKNIIEFIIKLLKPYSNGNYRKIECIIKITNIKFNISISKDEVYDYLKRIINNIGEEVYREKLLIMLDNCFKIKTTELENLEKEKQRIEERINQIKENMYD